MIYNSEGILGELINPEAGDESGKRIYKGGLYADYQYLWVEYEPNPNADGYALDWTHEREWRWVNNCQDSILGPTPKQGVPLLLPSVFDYQNGRHIHYLPKIIVHTIDEQKELSQLLITEAPDWHSSCEDNYLRRYIKELSKVEVVSLEATQREPEIVKLEWNILDE